MAPGVLRAFNRVLIQDSTLVKLSPQLAKAFPGTSNQSGAKNGQLKIQAVYELVSQRFVAFGLSGFNRNDQAASGDVVGLARPGDLILRDLGYFVLSSFNRIARAGAFFLSRYRLKTEVSDSKLGRPSTCCAASSVMALWMRWCCWAKRKCLFVWWP